MAIALDLQTEEPRNGDVCMSDRLVPSRVTCSSVGQFKLEKDENWKPRNEYHEVLSPIELGDSAAKQWGCKFLQRFAGQGQVASEGFQDSQWMEGQLILVNEYFSFAWLPIGHQVFFGRPTPELILKLMKDENKRGSVNDHLSPARSFLEKCWEETEHIEDDMEIDRQHSMSTNSYYDQEGCFE